jgi:hypothetical protein
VAGDWASKWPTGELNKEIQQGDCVTLGKTEWYSSPYFQGERKGGTDQTGTELESRRALTVGYYWKAEIRGSCYPSEISQRRRHKD